ncbi:MAG: helix-turn-helix domain-containing protein [Lachnospiraceae bacterium]
MKLSELINQYMEEIDCTPKELSEASDLSSAVISRYRSGEREPGIDSEQLEKLAKGITLIAEAKCVESILNEDVLSKLQSALKQRQLEFKYFAKNFATIVDVLQIKMKDLSAATNFDVSYLYRVRSGERKPNDLNAFLESISQFIVETYTDQNSIEKLNQLMNYSCNDSNSKEDLSNALKDWFLSDASEDLGSYMETFLQKLDEFDLDEYIRSIHFDELKVPSMPFYRVASKNYYGVHQMRKCELEFFKGTVLSKSKEPVFMCSDMPMADLAEDMDFNKKWMFGIAASLKKGLHLDIIHNIDRPFNEMMLGLEAWIPIYMTGQISPYHLPDISTNIYHHINYVSGAAALTGECIDGHHSEGKYYLTSNKEEIAYYRKQADNLLSKAKPLMTIYRDDSKKQFQTFESNYANEERNRHNILSSLPLYTISDDLLKRILAKTDVGVEITTEILEYAKSKREFTEITLKKCKIYDEIPYMSHEEFEKFPMHLALSGVFLEREIPYTYEEYIEHLELTKAYAKEHENYEFCTDSTLAFRNIQIQMLEGKRVIISKEKAPTIQFVIQHPKMVRALEQFIPPVNEG